MDGSPQCGCSNATTLWHLDAAEWAPSTASKGNIEQRPDYVCFTPEMDIGEGKCPNGFDLDPSRPGCTVYVGMCR